MNSKILVILLLTAFILGCSGEGSSDVSGDSTPMATDGANEKGGELNLSEGINIYPGLSIFNEIDGKAIGILSQGEVVFLTGNSGKNKKDSNFVEFITKNEVKGWTWAAYIFDSYEGAIVKGDTEAFVFSKADDNSLLDSTIAPLTFLVVDKETKSDKFLKVSWMEGNNILSNFILADDATFSSNDILASRIVKNYEKSKNQEVSNELLENLNSIGGGAGHIQVYLNTLPKKGKELNPDIDEIRATIEVENQIQDGDMVTLTGDKPALNSVEVDFGALDYLFIEGYSEDNNLEITIHNASVANLVTLPGILSIDIDGAKQYLGVIDAMAITSGEKTFLGIEVDGAELSDNHSLELEFANGTKVLGTLVVEGE